RSRKLCKYVSALASLMAIIFIHAIILNSIRITNEVRLTKEQVRSYALAQVCVHNMSLREETNVKDRIKEEWIGRTPKRSQYKILRQSLPYGTLSDKS
ncbi:hypothetical protein EWB00_010162, partial [Schistosoma japonicum]